MARFVVKIGKKQVETDATEIAIGTRSSCTISIDDPIAAEVHAWIRSQPDGFTIEDAASSTGTWRNGLPVLHPEKLSSGDAIVVGCARIRATLSESEGGATLSLGVEERSFFYRISRKRKEAGRWVVGGDAEDWVRSEVGFGRFRPVSLAAWAAGGLGLLLLCSYFLPAWRNVTLQPGDLHASHAELFARPTETFADSEAVGFAEHAHEHGCSACHGTFGGTPMEKCASCHSKLMEGRHPFPLGRSSSGGMVGFELGEDTCSSCHLDHLGAVPARGTFIPAMAMTPDTCTQCHGEGQLLPASRRLAADDLPSRMVTIDYDLFPHSKHLRNAGGDPIACSLCHVAQVPGAELDTEPGRLRRDFPPVVFETCMGCHSAHDEPVEGSPWTRRPEWRDHWAPAEKQVDLAWHGARGPENAERCMACHATLHKEDLRKVVTLETDERTFDLVRRDHAEFFANHVKVYDALGAKRECIECHVDGAPLSASTPQTRRFWHALHVESLAPPEDAARARTISEQDCRRCHVEQIDARHLAGTLGAVGTEAEAAGYHGPPTTGPQSRCADCHRDGNGEPLSIAPHLAMPATATPAGPALVARRVPRTDFPHSIHLAARSKRSSNGEAEPLAADCFACHSFANHAQAFEAMPTTLPTAANCTACHAQHRNVGGGGCEICHTREGKEDRVFAKATYERRWPEKNGFRHASDGHAALLEEPDGCVICHLDLSGAETVSEVPIPIEADEACWRCHVEEKRQFHWRGRNR